MTDLKRLDGRIAFITGGGRGIGRAIAQAYAAEGARLALLSRTAAELEETALLVKKRFGAEAFTVVADMSNREQLERAVAQVVGHYGAIDVLVNNAGNIGPVGRVWDNDPDEWGPHDSSAFDGSVLRLPLGPAFDAETEPGPHCQHGGSRRSQHLRL